MAKLYELTADYEALFSELDRLYSIEDEMTEQDGQFFHDGVLVEDVAEYKHELLTAWFDTLEGIEGEVEQKLLKLACFVKNIDSDALAIKAEKDKLAKRQKSTENKSKRIREYILNVMQTMNIKKIESPVAVIKYSEGRESVKIADDNQFISWAEVHNGGLLSYKQPDISKTAVKAAINAGEKIPFASLEKTPTINIK